MEIYFLRHGIAAERAPDGADSPDRPLTSEGMQKVESAARGMRRLGVEVDVLLTSPLRRARQTAEIVGKILEVHPEVAEALGPGCGAEAVMRLLGAREARRAMVVGHEPDLSMIVSALTGGSALQLKKCGLALVELPADEGQDGVLHWLLPPRVLRLAGGG